MTNEKEQIYEKMFRPEYNLGNFAFAEKVARYGDLGGILEKNELITMKEFNLENAGIDMNYNFKLPTGVNFNSDAIARTKYWAQFN